jgi:hypothetical protein
MFPTGMSIEYPTSERGVDAMYGTNFKMEALELLDNIVVARKGFVLPTHLLIMAHYNRGFVLRSFGRLEDAIASFRETARVPGASILDRILALQARAGTLTNLGHFNLSKSVIDEAISLEPTVISSYLYLIGALEGLGHFKGLRLKLSNKNAEQLRIERRSSIVDILNHMRDSMTKASALSGQEVLRDLESKSVLTTAGLASIVQNGFEHANFALFRLEDALGGFGSKGRAWEALQAGHALASARLPQHPLGSLKAGTAQIAGLFEATFYPTPSLGLRTKVPVFIIGMPRCGSTLLESILDSNPAFYGMGEDSIFNSNLEATRTSILNAMASKSEKQGVPAMLVRRSVEMHAAQIAMKMKVVARQALKKAAAAVRKGSSGERSSLVPRDNANVLAASLVKKSKNLQFVIDKMLRNYINVGFIHLIYPEAHIIHLVRDPLDTLWSILKNYLSDTLPLMHSVPLLLEEYTAYLELMAHWHATLPNRVIDLPYSVLVSEPESTLRLLLATLNVPWRPEVLQYYRFQRHVLTASSSSVRQAPYVSSIGNWRRYRHQLGPLIVALRPILLRLRREGKLPFVADNTTKGWRQPHLINWALDEEFDYGPRVTPMDEIRRQEQMENFQNETIEDTLLVDRADPDEVMQPVDKDDTEGEDWEWVEEEVWIEEDCIEGEADCLCSSDEVNSPYEIPSLPAFLKRLYHFD